MKRFLASALILSLFSVCTMIGCSQESKVESDTKKSTPEGTVNVHTEEVVKKTGDEKTPTPETPKPEAPTKPE